MNTMNFSDEFQFTKFEWPLADPEIGASAWPPQVDSAARGQGTWRGSSDRSPSASGRLSPFVGAPDSDAPDDFGRRAALQRPCDPDVAVAGRLRVPVGANRCARPSGLLRRQRLFTSGPPRRRYARCA